jgi:fructoselysine-6-P-deglycase FrlB-like protein/hydroxymethylpyrimidine pyrophosphatase-like HAD family hydrolase
VGKAYSSELLAIPETLRWAQRQEIRRLKVSVQYCHDKSVLAIGSGGSSTASAFVAGLHERKFGRLSRAVTPLEVCTGPHFDDVAAIFLSAEGKNKDILAAAEAIVGINSGNISLTLTSDNPLLEYCESSGAATPIGFDMPWEKDGYLATNSLIAMMTLFARAYADADVPFDTSMIDEQWILQRREELANSETLRRAAEVAQVIVLYGGSGKSAAIDLESKMAEGALGSCQPVDYRQFSHGRHLQLAVQNPPIIIALGSERDQALMEATIDQFPEGVLTLKLILPSGFALGELVGVIYAMLIVEVISAATSIDVGQPTVPEFGRALYNIDVRNSIGKYTQTQPTHLYGKIPLVGIETEYIDSWIAAGLAFVSRLEAARFKGIVFDFDGTCCFTPRRFEGPDSRVAIEISRVIEGGLPVAFASGRGDSLQDDLREAVPPQHWHQVLMGYYSGSVISWLSEDFIKPQADRRFALLHSWLIEHGLVISSSAVKVEGQQMSIRLAGKHSKESITTAISHWLKTNKHHGWRVFCSAHSVDVLTDNAGKNKVVEAFARLIEANPEDQILRIGDSGHFSGNDYELLSEGVGLSVAAVSPLKPSCWNLLPDKQIEAFGTYHYLSSLEIDDGKAKFSEIFLRGVRASLMGMQGDR